MSHTIPLYVFCTSDGNPASNKLMTGNYSVTPGQFFHVAPAGFKLEIHSITFHAGGQGQMAAEKYGTIATLTNGIQIVTATGGNLDDVSADFTAGTPILSNADWGRFGANTFLSTYGVGDNYVSNEYVLPAPLELHGLHGDCFGVKLNDDFSSLNDHTVFLKGYMYKE